VLVGEWQLQLTVVGGMRLWEKGGHDRGSFISHVFRLLRCDAITEPSARLFLFFVLIFLS
jgi:hypothetical protein